MAQVTIRRDAQPSMNVTSHINSGGGIQLQSTPSAKVASGPGLGHRGGGSGNHAPPSPIDEDSFDDDALKDIVNPGKVRNEGSDASSYTTEDDNEEYEYDPDNEYDDESPDRAFAPPAPAKEQPSAGFLTIDDEKADILFKLELLRKQGLEGRRFSARDDIREMRAELARIKTHLEMDRSLKFSRKALVGLTAALEFMNDKVDVLDLELDGWSEQMHQAVYNQKEYDGIFEELFFKYRNKVKTPPEIRLIMAVGGSALSFHITNSMMKKSKTDTPTFDPVAIQKMLKSSQQDTPPPAAPPATEGGRREMRPPGFGGFGSLTGLAGGDVIPQFGISPNPTQSRMADINIKPNVTFSNPLVVPGHGDDDQEDRMSDVPSDLESVPSSMSSPEESLVKSIPLNAPKRGGAGTKPDRRVIEI